MRVAVILCLLARSVLAHPLDIGYLTIDARGDRVAVELEVDAGVAAKLLGEPVDAARVQASATTLAARSFAGTPILSVAGACRWLAASASVIDRSVRVAQAADCAGARPSRWTFPFIASVSPRFQLMVKERERLTLVDAASGSYTLSATATRFTDFVASGIRHIGVAPREWRSEGGGLKLPDGIDHILFLLALILGGGRLLRLVGVATGFTVGHSITLALSALGVVQPPMAVIEPLIALTIVIAATEAFTDRLAAQRWKIAMAFGLVHGFAFATALAHLELTTRGKLTALLGYNLGVEIGQIVVVLVAAPLIVLAHRSQRTGMLVTRIAASAIGACGVYWFVERLA